MRKILNAVRGVPGVRGVWDTAVAVLGNVGSGPRHLSAGERRVLADLQRDGIRRELANRAAAAHAHEERQRHAFDRLWRTVRSADDDLTPPPVLRASSSADFALALTVVGEFDAAREEPGPFAECLYRPVADLPYPEHDIRRCCEFLIGIADSPPDSFAGNYELLAKERDALGVALFSLDYFLDLPESEIPRKKMQNLAFARRHDGAGPPPVAKPRAGERIVRESGAADHVVQVLGLAGDDEWMVLADSGIATRVRNGPTLKEWTEVQEVTAVAAHWLDLTPPAGMPSVEV